MNWLEIMRLIMVLWPLIEQLINAIGESQKREEAADAVTNVVANLLNGTVPVNNSLDVVSALAAPLKIAV